MVTVYQVAFDENGFFVEEQLYPEMSGCVRVLKSRNYTYSEEVSECPVIIR